MNSIENLETIIENLTKKRDWCKLEVEGLSRQIDDSYRNKDYWDVKDLISQRREEAWFFDFEIEKTKKELEKLKSAL